ncbi:hypothetical protein HY491_00970 [Candidatus Woesearchaeota archaeon]|nr:hypothetical protein [Candidatus Woesearchaeota archaeon]
MGDIQITYEALFEIERREKEKKELQKLDPDFMEQLGRYLSEKEAMVAKQRNAPDLFAFDEQKKGLNQVESIKRLVTSLYDLREKKIIASAANKARLSTAMINPAAFLPLEKELFEQLVALLSHVREQALGKVMHYSRPPEEPKQQEKQDTSDVSAPLPESPTKTVRFTHPVPRFLGTSMETFGPYEPEDIAALPREIVQALVSRGRAEEIESSGAGV